MEREGEGNRETEKKEWRRGCRYKNERKHTKVREREGGR